MWLLIHDGIKLIQVSKSVLFVIWISNYIDYKVPDEITYSFSKFNDCAVEVWEWDK